ncbi:MAG TPA: hypothetical protein H9977_10810, partial [Candidatus Parabacteroides intestinipullorum]|nr:hypothetical protein [Candidatus Parabacteroides intestinipullorum]
MQRRISLVTHNSAFPIHCSENPIPLQCIGKYCCPIKILQKTKNRADFICEVSPFSLDFRRQTNQSNYGQKYTF